MIVLQRIREDIVKDKHGKMDEFRSHFAAQIKC